MHPIQSSIPNSLMVPLIKVNVECNQGTYIHIEYVQILVYIKGVTLNNTFHYHY